MSRPKSSAEDGGIENVTLSARGFTGYQKEASSLGKRYNNLLEQWGDRIQQPKIGDIVTVEELEWSDRYYTGNRTDVPSKTYFRMPTWAIDTYGDPILYMVCAFTKGTRYMDGGNMILLKPIERGNWRKSYDHTCVRAIDVSLGIVRLTKAEKTCDFNPDDYDPRDYIC